MSRRRARSRHKLAPPLGPLPACVTQSCFKAFLELFPALLLRVCTALYSRKVMLYRCHSSCHARALPLRALSRLSPPQLPAGHVPSPHELLPSAAVFRGAAALSRTRQRRGGRPSHQLSGLRRVLLLQAALCRAARAPSNDAALGRSACSRKATSDPTGRRRTMPGFAIAAAMTLLSFDSLRKPLMKKIVVRAPGFERRLHRWSRYGKIIEALRCLVDLKFARHGEPMSRETALFRAARKRAEG